MRVYSLAEPSAPNYLSSVEHMRACDPVVVQGDLAYVTLRSGNNNCAGISNELQVVNIKDIAAPSLLTTYGMHSPTGVGIDGQTLFVCDGDEGLKIYDATDPMAIDQHLLKKYPDIHAIDVIPHNGLLMAIGTDGLYQYDYSDLNNIKQISALKISK